MYTLFSGIGGVNSFSSFKRDRYEPYVVRQEVESETLSNRTGVRV